MSSRCNSGKNSPAKLMDSPDDIRRRKELAERKMRERHQLIKREHCDKLRKDLEEHARLQRELKEKEARELRRQQEIIQKNLERLNRDEQRRKELLARNHAATSRTAARNVAFGSSTPRELSYLDRLPKSQKAYDKKLSPPPPSKESEVRTPKTAPNPRRSNALMVSSMYVPSSPRTKPTPVSRTSTPKTTNLMTQSFYTARTTSSAGTTRPSPNMQNQKSRVPPRPSTRAGLPPSGAGGKPPLPSSTPSRRLTTNKLTNTTKPNRTKEDKVELPIPATIPETIAVPEKEPEVEAAPPTLAQTAKQEELTQADEIEPQTLVALIESQETQAITEALPDLSSSNNDPSTESFVDIVEPVALELKSDVVKDEIPGDSSGIDQSVEGQSLAAELSELVVEEATSENNQADNEQLIPDVEQSADISAALSTHEENSELALENVSLASELNNLVENDVTSPVQHSIIQTQEEPLSLAQELSGLEDHIEPLPEQSETEIIAPSLQNTIPEQNNDLLSANVNFNINENEQESIDSAPAEPNTPAVVDDLLGDLIDVGVHSLVQPLPNIVTEGHSLASELLDLDSSNEPCAEPNVLSVANHAFDIAQHVNPTEFTTINENPTNVVGDNNNVLSDSENDKNENLSFSSLNITEKEHSTQEKPEVLPEADQVKISSLPPSPPIQQKSKETDVPTNEEPQKKESDVRARLAAVLSKTREGRVSPTEKPVPVEAAATAVPVKFSASTAALLQRLKDSGRASDKLSSLITRHGSDSALEENPEDPRPVEDLLD